MSMTIYLANVVGINRIDTPKFTSLANQEAWFDSFDTKQISSTFYPPHYKNVIRIDTRDVDFTDTYNYLWFEYKNKRYYYFIDDIEYINESLINLYITMDYIQTYMFNIRLINGIIERKFINRWKLNPITKVWSINRDFLRENVSGGLFEALQKVYVNQTDLLCTIVKYTTIPNNARNPSVQTEIKLKKTEGISPFLYRIFVPHEGVYDKVTLEQYIDNPSAWFTLSNTYLISQSLKEASAVDAFVVPFSFLSNLMYIQEIDGVRLLVLKNFYSSYGEMQGVITLDGVGDNKTISEYYWEQVNFQPGNNIYKSALPSMDIEVNFNQIVSLNFERNTSLNTSFNSKYIPQMFDENYMYLVYGNNYSNFVIPSHYVNNISNLKVKTYYAPNQGVYESYAVINFDDNQHNVMCTDTNVPSVDLINSAWNDYIANNKNRWASAGLKTGINFINQLIHVGTKTAFVNKDLMRLWTDNKSYTPKRHLPKKSAVRRGNNIVDDAEERISNLLTSDVFGSATPLLQQAIEDDNVTKIPNTVQQIGEYISEYCTFDKFLYSQSYKVNDYDKCASYFHRNGFHVEEYINNINNIFDYVSTRYYFNVLKMSDSNIILDGCITDNSTLEGINERLKDGVRLWNVENNDVVMGNFTYDNVEISYLS